LSEPSLFDSSFLYKLDRLLLLSRRRVSGDKKGERRSVRHGNSLEFADFRHYVPGDDPRQVDWNAYGRTGSLYLKLFEEEEVLTTHLLLDVSASMDWGDPNKLDYARRLAAALGYIALSGLDRVEAAAISDGGVAATFGPAWSRRQVAPLFGFLTRLRARGQTDLGLAVGRYVQGRRRPGLAVLISDLLSPSAESGIKRLIAARYDVIVLHVLAPQEQTPPPGEGLRLIDRESGKAVEVFVDQRTIDMYQERFHDWCAGIQNACARHGVRYRRIDTATPLEQTVFGLLQRGGILR
jgi:uncharacterized protein (DUF58 family)